MARLFPRPSYYIAATIGIVGVLCVVSMSASTPVWASGNVYQVNSAADTSDADVGNPACADVNGKCTLRAAIMQANYTAGADTIVLPAGTYKLTRAGDDDSAVVGDLDITDDVTIQGAGSGKTVIDGNGKVTRDRVFQVLSTAKQVSLSGLTIKNGVKTANTFDEGGGLYWDGSGSHLSLTDVVVETNRARYGGGIFLNYSTLGDVVDLAQIVLHANTATTGAAGGLGANFGDFATFALTASKVYSNTAYEGGGVYFGGTPSFGLQSVHIETTDIYSNTATLSGGLENHSGDSSVPVVVTNSHFHNNPVGLYGGAIGNYGTLALSDTTLDKNAAGTAGTGRGGGLWVTGNGNANLTNVTLSGNSAGDSGGAIFTDGAGSTTAFVNVTLSGNTANSNGGIYRSAGALSFTNTVFAHGANGFNCSESFGIVFPNNANLSDDGSCDFGTGRDFVSNLLLAPLANNGGLAPTHLPASGSAVINAGTSSGAPGLDERSVPRPQGAGIDVGAVERCSNRPDKPVLVSPSNGKQVKLTRVTLDWNDAVCATKYVVKVRVGSTTGAIVYNNKNARLSQDLTPALTRGQVYYWQVTAAGDTRKTKSDWWSFSVK